MLIYEQVETLLQELNNRKVDAFLKDDQKLVEALSGDIDALRRWLEGGMVSPCPIDLRPYGFEDSPAQVLAEETGAGQKMVEPEVVTQIAPPLTEERDVVEEPESKLGMEPVAKEERPEPDHTLANEATHEDTAGQERKETMINTAGENSFRPSFDETFDRSVLDETWRKRQRQQDLQRHINRARQALEEKDLPIATSHLDDAEAIDAENTEVATLRNLIRKAEEQKRVTDLINDLNTDTDIASLFALIQIANEMLSRGQFPELAAAKETAYRRYEDKKQLQGIATTQAAMEDYEQAKKSIRQIERDIADGQKKWNFRGQYRDIQEVASELKTQQIHNATTLANGVKAKALAYMQGETHSPHVALKTLEGAFQYVEMSSETKQDLEKTQAVLQQEALEFDRAEEELTKASGDVNPLTRLQHLRQATALYPYHPNLKSLRAEYLRGAAAAAAQEADRAIERAGQHLTNEEVEAVERITRGDRGASLKAFTDARTALESAREKLQALDDVLEELMPNDREKLRSAATRLDQMSSRINERENRRNAIRTRYLQINAQLQQKGNAQLGKQLYLETDPDLEKDQVIKLLWPRIQGMLSDTDRLQTAEGDLRSDNWEGILEKVREIKDPKLIPQKDRLQGLAYLHIWEKRIREQWGLGYYEDADKTIEQVMTYTSSIAEVIELRSGIITRLDLEVRRAELQARRKVSDDHGLVGKIERLKNDLPALAQSNADINILKKGDSTLDRIMGIYERICTFEALESSYAGMLHDWKRRIEAALLTRLISELEQLKERPGERKRAFRYAQILWKNRLTEETSQTELCRDTILAYYEEQNQPLKERGDWEKLLRNWETAVKDFGGELSFLRQKLAELRHEYLLISLDKALESLDQDRAAQILRHQLNPCVFEFSLPFIYDVEADPEIQLRQVVLRIFTDADVLTEAGKFEESIQKIDEKYASLPEATRIVFERAINRKRNQVSDLALETLLQTGYNLDAPVTERTYAFARVLRFDPQNTQAATWLRDNADEVRFEIDQKVSQGAQIEIGPDNVEEQLGRVKELLDALRSFLSVCDTLKWLTRDEVDLAIQRLESVLGNLQRANAFIQDYSLEGIKWQSALRTGAWTKSEEDLDELRHLLEQPLGDHQQLTELSARMQQARVDRELMNRSKGNLETSFNADSFETALANIGEIDTILFRYTGRHIEDVAHLPKEEEPDPFRILARGYQLFEVFTRSFVPFFPNGTKLFVKSLLEIRKQNCDSWNARLQAIQRRRLVINEIEPNIRKPYNQRMKEMLEEYLLAFHEEQPEQCEAEIHALRQMTVSTIKECPELLPWMSIDLPEPNSGKASHIKQQIEKEVVEAQEQLRTARANWVRIHQREQELYAELDQLEKNFLQGPETVTRLSAIYEFFEAGSDTRLQTYLNHLRQMAVEQPGRQRRN